jgi:hypothetical protein
MNISYLDIARQQRNLSVMGAALRRAITILLMLVALYLGASTQAGAAVSEMRQPCQLMTMTHGTLVDTPCKPGASIPGMPGCPFAPACVGVIALEPPAPQTPWHAATWTPVWYGRPSNLGAGRSIAPDLLPPIPFA